MVYVLSVCLLHFSEIKLLLKNEETFLFFSFKEMIIDKVNGQAVPRYLIYDIIKFNVSTFIISKWIVTEIIDVFNK